METLTTHSTAFRFRRFCRQGWAAYSSMHREVTIGHVSADIADLQLRKDGRTDYASVALVRHTGKENGDEESDKNNAVDLVTNRSTTLPIATSDAEQDCAVTYTTTISTAVQPYSGRLSLFHNPDTNHLTQPLL